MKRIALVGYGRIAPRHLEVFRALDCQVVASCNRSERGREKAHSEGGIANTYASIEAMLDRERPDGVVCCASAEHMAEAAKQILSFGLPTLLEKPPGISLAELAEIKSRAIAQRAPVMVGLNRRYYSVLTRAIEDAGGPEAITAVFVDWSEEPEYLLRDRGFAPQQVAQRVYGNSLHGLDLLTFLAGYLPAPHVVGLSFGEPFRWIMSLQGVSSRGVLGTFQSTWDSPGRWRLVFCARKRRYQFAPLESCVVSELEKKETRTIEPDVWDKRFKPGFYRQARTFLEAIDSGQVPALHGLDSAAMAMSLAEQLTQACLRSGAAAAPNKPA
jgi:predicted dehydrogenase